jgi:hypothetical protein
MKKRSDCKGAARRKAYLRKWYKANRSRILAKIKEPEQAARRLELHQKWAVDNADRLRELMQARRARETPAGKARRLEKNRASYRARRIRQGFAVMPLKTSR